MKSRKPRFAIALALVVIVTVLGGIAVLTSGSATGAPKTKPPALSPQEQQLISSVEQNQSYALGVVQHQFDAGPVVAGATDDAAAQYLAAQMQAIGLDPGGQSGGYLEDFTIYGWEPQPGGEPVSTITISDPAPRQISVTQYYKGAGTGPAGLTAPVVYVDLGRWGDFERTDVRGKIILFHRQDPLWYGVPPLFEAKARGAVGAMMDYPRVAPDVLHNDVILESIPTVYVTTNDANAMRDKLAAGQQVTAHLVVDNKVGHYPTAHNVIGIIPGSTYPEEFVYLGAHFDHWFGAATDDNAGVGSVLAIAKAWKDSGIAPKRTLVFCLWDSEELGGHQDTWYDWCIGSYAHIAATLKNDGTLGAALHPDRVGKIAAYLNMDVIGFDGLVQMEATPDLSALYWKAARDTGVTATATTNLYIVSSYDDWSFYMVGVPAGEIAWRGAAYKGIYHTPNDTMDKIDPEHFRINLDFNAVAMMRVAQAGVGPYSLDENVQEGETGLVEIVAKDPAVFASGNADASALRQGIADYRAALGVVESKMAAKKLTKAQTQRINATVLKSAMALNEHLYDWDTTIIPGWGGVFILDQYGSDLSFMNTAISALAAGDTAAAAQALGEVTTMEWGQELGSEAYQGVLDQIYFTPHPLWAEGFMPRLTLVHDEYMSLKGRSASGTMTRGEIIASLTEKRDAIYDSVTASCNELGKGYSDAAKILLTM